MSDEEEVVKTGFFIKAGWSGETWLNVAGEILVNFVRRIVILGQNTKPSLNIASAFCQEPLELVQILIIRIEKLYHD